MKVVTRCLSLCLIATVLAIPTPAPATACEEVQVETFEVKMRAMRGVYERGDTARVEVIVTRRDTGERASDIDVGVGGSTNDDFWTWDTAQTGPRGRVVLHLKLDGMPPGWMTLNGYAWRETVDTACAGVREYGYDRKNRAFRVRD